MGSRVGCQPEVPSAWACPGPGGSRAFPPPVRLAKVAT